MGEGESMGPVNDAVREKCCASRRTFSYEIKWNTLAEYLRYLEARGSPATSLPSSGATTIRENVIGFEDKAPTPQQLDEMRALVRRKWKPARSASALR
jgi:N-acyl-D-amino-acid deacylase